MKYLSKVIEIVKVMFEFSALLCFIFTPALLVFSTHYIKSAVI